MPFRFAKFSSFKSFEFNIVTDANLPPISVSSRLHQICVHKPGGVEQPLARFRDDNQTEEASCTSHLCVVSPPRCQRLRQWYIRLWQAGTA